MSRIYSIAVLVLISFGAGAGYYLGFKDGKRVRESEITCVLLNWDLATMRIMADAIKERRDDFLPTTLDYTYDRVVRRIREEIAVRGYSHELMDVIGSFFYTSQQYEIPRPPPDVLNFYVIHGGSLPKKK